MKYVLVCSSCGKERRSHKNPTTPTTQKLCRQCSLDAQRVILARMMRRQVDPSRWSSRRESVAAGEESGS